MGNKVKNKNKKKNKQIDNVNPLICPSCNGNKYIKIPARKYPCPFCKTWNRCGWERPVKCDYCNGTKMATEYEIQVCMRCEGKGHL